MINGILLIDKPGGMTSFQLVSFLRKRTKVKKIGHAGTLDPLATGVMIMLIGKQYTRQSDKFLQQKKRYLATIMLGKSTDTYDSEGQRVNTSDHVPALEDVQNVIEDFQGTIEQIPPMYSAKKIKGQKLYELARKGKSVERAPQKIDVAIHIVNYQYPYLEIDVICSKGTYIRTLAHDIGHKLQCYGHITQLKRTESSPFNIDQCIKMQDLQDPTFEFSKHLILDIPTSSA